MIPTLTLLVGVGIACWWWGRTPMTAELGDRLRSYLQGAVVLALAALLGFVGLVPRHELDWQPYSRVASRRTLEAKDVRCWWTSLPIGERPARQTRRSP